MPDPIGATAGSVDWCSSEGGEVVGSTTSAPPGVSANARSTSEIPGEGAVPPGTALLTRKFQEDHYAFLAAAAAGPKDSVPVTASSVPAPTPALLPNPEDQLGLQVGVPRLEGHATLGGLHLAAAVDILNANAHLGSQNDDGSKGENVGAVANGVGVEVTGEYSGWSLTAGLSASLGASVSSGAGRDLDGDGHAERCFKVSFGPLTLGECDEL